MAIWSMATIYIYISIYITSKEDLNVLLQQWTPAHIPAVGLVQYLCTPPQPADNYNRQCFSKTSHNQSLILTKDKRQAPKSVTTAIILSRERNLCEFDLWYKTKIREEREFKSVQIHVSFQFYHFCAMAMRLKMPNLIRVMSQWN